MVNRETNSERVLQCVRRHPEGIDDDQISAQTGVQPRQQVYQIATHLEAEGLIARRSVVKIGKRKKIHNFPASGERLPFENGDERGSGEILLWKKRLAALVAATGMSETDILDKALEGYARDFLKNSFS